MCLGVMPTRVVADVYKLREFYDLGQAVIKGHIAEFDRIMQKHQSSFVRIGVYLVLEQLKMLTYRNLFRRIYLIIGNTRLNLLHFETVLHGMGQTETDLDEIECLLTNLIYQNKVKGYISHQKRYLIVSKNDAFPKTAVVNKAS